MGPLLFLLYINDIVNSSSYLKFLLYADDSILYVSGKDINDLIRTTNNELVTVSEWLASNKLTLNLEKSHYLIFNRNKTFPDEMPPLTMCTKTLTRQSFTKFLGVIIDEQLNFKEHIINITNKINKQSGILYLTRDSLTIAARKQIYYSLVYPYRPGARPLPRIEICYLFFTMISC